MQNDGSLIAVAAEDPSKTKKIAAIVSNIWYVNSVVILPSMLHCHAVVHETRCYGTRSSYDKVAIQALQCVVLENEVYCLQSEWFLAAIQATAA